MLLVYSFSDLWWCDTGDGEFILAFARRNVPMDKVIAVAEPKGLHGEILDGGIHSMEPIYRFKFV